MIGVGREAASPRSARRARSRASERECWIALALVPGIGPAGFYRLLRRHGSAAGAWDVGAAALDGLALEPDVRAAAAERLLDEPRVVARAVVRSAERAGGRVVTAIDAEGFPPALLNLEPRPPMLTVAGDATAFGRRAVAVVGTRRASGYGLATATEIAAELAQAGIVIVSGLALGIDGAAHRAAIEAGRPTIAVLPAPLDRIYPPRHRPLARDIVRTGGALVTEMPIGARIGRPDFARRNRIIAGLGEAVVVVEAPDRSGALLTAAAAMSIGRELYAVPGPIDAAASRGTNRLIADHHAVMVTSSGGLLRQIGVDRGRRAPAIEHLSEVEGQLLRHLLDRSGSLEELVDRAGQSPASVASALTLLEARGLVNAFGGATFHPTLAARRLAKVV